MQIRDMNLRRQSDLLKVKYFSFPITLPSRIKKKRKSYGNKNMIHEAHWLPPNHL